MKINTNSWHFKIVQDLNAELPKTLCGYIGAFVLNSVIIIGLILVMGYIAVALFAPLWLAITLYLFPEPYILFDSPLLIGIGVIGYILALCYFVITWSVEFSHRAGEKIEKAENPFTKYLKDKHDKVCTLVEYE